MRFDYPSAMLGTCVMLLIAVFVYIPVHAGIPQCTEDEVVTVKSWLWVKIPDECVNREDANFEFGYWTTEE